MYTVYMFNSDKRCCDVFLRLLFSLLCIHTAPPHLRIVHHLSRELVKPRIGAEISTARPAKRRAKDNYEGFHI